MVFFGGLVIGILVGFVAFLMQQPVEDTIYHGLISVIAAYFAFLIAENTLHVSGVMAVLALGLVLGKAHRADYTEDNFVEHLWTFNAYMANALVLMLMGFSVSMAMFQERWLAILIGIVAVLVARLIGIFILVPIATLFTSEELIDLRYQAVLFWGGLRRAVTFVLVLAIPTEMDYWWTIQSTAFGVVVYTLFIHAPTMNRLLKKVRLLQTH